VLIYTQAAKYKEYNKARDILSGKIVQPAPSQRQTPRKRKHEDGHGLPSKRFHIMKTPSKNSMQPWEVDPYESPSAIRNLFTPSRKTAIGPTPQKDGQVLGIFDLLEEGGTPSKGPDGCGASIQMSIYATPRKPTSQAHGTPSHARTPTQTGKQSMLDKFGTPATKPHPNKQTGDTPSSVSKLHFSTPSFLRRDSQRPQMLPTDNNDEFVALSPEPVRVPRKPLVRGLSSILAGLRKIEEEAADDDLDALREMENETGPNNPPANIKVPALDAALVDDSQPRLPLGGFDDEGMFDSEPEEMKNPTLGRDGKPLKDYKKRGQKRTTRRVNLKPSRSKPQAEPEQPQNDSEDEPVGAAEMVPDTQVDDAADFDEARNFDSDSQSEYTASEGGTRYRRPDQTRKRERTKDGKLKTVARKVNALAHQNFKRLKLRNSGAKGGAAHNSRFRRKR
jgi:DNA replication regulator SLD2